MRRTIMDTQLKEALEARLAEAKAKEAELWELHKETEKWAEPVIKRHEEARSRWADQCKKCQIISRFLEDEL